MPQRFLKPGLTASQRFAAVGWAAQSLFVRLITLVDDHGRYEADPLQVARMAFPFGDPARRVVPEGKARAWLDELAGADLLHVYEVNGRRYLQMRRWTERTRSASKYPAPDGLADNCAPLTTDAVSRAQPTANAASPPSPSPSPSPSSSPREEEGGAALRNTAEARRSGMEASKMQFAALKARLDAAEAAGKSGILDAGGLVILKKMRGAFAELQKKQARGDWSPLDLAAFGL